MVAIPSDELETIKCRRRRIVKYRKKQQSKKWSPAAILFSFPALQKYSKYSGIPTEQLETNFRIAEDKRTFKLRLNDGDLFVNPHYFAIISEDFAEQFNAQNQDVHGEVCYDKFKIDDMLLVLKAVCPTKLQHYPVPLTIFDLDIALPIIHRLRMTGLLQYCEKLVENDYKFLKRSEVILQCFDYAFRCGLSLNLQSRLLYQLLCHNYDFLEFITYDSINNILCTETGSLLIIALTLRNRNGFTNEDLSRVVCLSKLKEFLQDYPASRFCREKLVSY